MRVGGRDVSSDTRLNEPDTMNYQRVESQKGQYHEQHLDEYAYGPSPVQGHVHEVPQQGLPGGARYQWPAPPPSFLNAPNLHSCTSAIPRPSTKIETPTAAPKPNSLNRNAERYMYRTSVSPCSPGPPLVW